MVFSGLFAAILPVCAWLAVPVGDMVLTMQTFGAFMALSLLGGKWGTVSILVYLLLGAVGLPVFSGFRGGPGMLLGITGGYLWGFLCTGLCYWAMEKLGKIPAMIAGIFVCYICGTVWFCVYGGGAGVIAALTKCVLPYLVPDAVKLALALSISRRLTRFVPENA